MRLNHLQVPEDLLLRTLANLTHVSRLFDIPELIDGLKTLQHEVARFSSTNTQHVTFGYLDSIRREALKTRALEVAITGMS